jgi:hypothetical protein
MANFPTGSESSITLAQLIPVLWGERINDFFKLKLSLGDFFIDRSAELADGGSALYTPNLTEMTANAKVNATAVSMNQPTETKQTLTVDQWYEVSFAIEDREAAQVKHSYYLQEKYAMNAGYTMARKLEVALAALFSGFSNTVGSSTTNVADSDIRAAIAQLESVGVDTSGSDVAFFIDSKVFWKQLQGIDKFSLAINAPVQDPVAKRPAAFLYGIPVYISNNIQYVSGTTGRWNALAQNDALHFATSPLGSNGSQASSEGTTMTGRYGVRVQSHYVPEYLSTITTADLLYGVTENRDNAGVAVLSPA